MESLPNPEVARDMRLKTAQRGRPLMFTWNGRPVPGFAGETVAAALLAHGVSALRRARLGDVRGVFCGMGACFECRVLVDGRGTVRACVTPIAEGMAVSEQVEAGPLDLDARAPGGRGV